MFFYLIILSKYDQFFLLFLNIFVIILVKDAFLLIEICLVFLFYHFCFFGFKVTLDKRISLFVSGLDRLIGCIVKMMVLDYQLLFEKIEFFSFYIIILYKIFLCLNDLSK